MKKILIILSIIISDNIASFNHQNTNDSYWSPNAATDGTNLPVLFSTLLNNKLAHNYKKNLAKKIKEIELDISTFNWDAITAKLNTQNDQQE